jgi:hypothetical protein
MTFVEEEWTTLQALAEAHPTLRDLRSVAPAGSARFISFTYGKSDNWPTLALLKEYLQSCEATPTNRWHPELDGEAAITGWLHSQELLRS